jgi:predicted DNA-binding protein (MmcQ/YjbR family)
MPKKRDRITILRDFALAFPGAHEDFPWGERVVKVKKKIFVFLGRDSKHLHITVKLPRSSALALQLPFVAPTGYGLGRAGWVTAELGPGASLPVSVLKAWIEESYAAVAPKVRAPRQGRAAGRRSG